MAQSRVYFEQELVRGDEISVPVTNKFGAEVLVHVTIDGPVEDVRRYVNKGRPLVRNRVFRATVAPEDRTRATAAKVLIEVLTEVIEDADNRSMTTTVYSAKG